MPSSMIRSHKFELGGSAVLRELLLKFRSTGEAWTTRVGAARDR